MHQTSKYEYHLNRVFLLPSYLENSLEVDFCEDIPLPMSCLDGQSDGKSTPLRDRDRLGNDPQTVPGFLSRCSWMFPKRLRNKSELVCLEEFLQI